MKLAYILFGVVGLSLSACKSTEMKGTSYNSGKKRNDGTGDKDAVEKNSAFKDPKKDGSSSDAFGNNDGQGGDNGNADANDLGSDEANADQGDLSAEASVIDVLRLCSNRYTEAAQTNLKGSQNGVVASLIPADGKNKPVHFHDAGTAQRIRNEVMNYGRFQLPLATVPGGAYELHLCAAGFAESCRSGNAIASEPATASPGTAAGKGRFAAVKPSFTPFASKPGLIGTALINVKKGRMESITGALLLQRPAIEVLTDVNKQDTAMKMQMFSMFGAAISAQSGQPTQQIQADLSGVEDCDNSVSPLIIDLGNDGVDLTPPFPGTSFDMDADGVTDQISWPKDARTMFLALDLNNNLKIDDGGELFGNNSLGPKDGKKSANGFLALAKFDDNGDRYIDAKDDVYSRLRLWSDLNHDGVSSEAELLTLASQGVEAIDLNFTEGNEKDVFGNSTRQRSVVKLKDGKLRLVVDIWFRKS